MKRKIMFFEIIVALIAIILVFMSACDNGNNETTCNHSWGEWIIETAPTCMETGKGTRTCKFCNVTDNNTAIPIDPNAHNWGDWIGTATCIEAGEGTRTCRYNVIHIETNQNLPALGHNINWTLSVVPICTTEGEEDGICTRDHCSYATTRIVPIDENAHDYGNWTKTILPNCTTAGIETGTCSHNPLHTTTRPGAAIDPTAHNWIWIETTPPSFFSSGKETEKCTICEITGETQIISTPLQITKADDWHTVITAIQNGGNNKEYTLSIGADFELDGTNINTFGSVSEITITITGNHVISLSVGTKGNLIKINKKQALVVEDLKLKGHSSNNSSLVYVDGGNLTMLGNASISDNVVSAIPDPSFGGGVYVNNEGTITMLDYSSVSGNTVTSVSRGSRGGGIYFTNGGTFTMQNNASLFDNTAHSSASYLSGDGGGVYFTSGGTFTMLDNASIRDNIASGYEGYAEGGGVYFGDEGTFIMQNNASISGNTATSYYMSKGGGVANWGTFIMQDNASICNNTASNYGDYNRSLSYGGGVMVGYGGGPLTMLDNASISGNIASAATVEGGGVHVTSYGTFSMQGNAAVSGNTASGFSTVYTSCGGGVYIFNGTFTMQENSSISDNTVSSNGSSHGGGVYVDVFNNPGIFHITGGIVVGNTAFGLLQPNSAKNYAALYNGGTSQYGTFNGITWNSNGNLSSTDNTIRVVNGVLQY